MHRKVAYYAAYFSAKPEDFDAASALKGKEVVRAKMDEIKHKGFDATAKEKAAIPVYQIINEMLCRGVELLPIDLYKSDAKLLFGGGREDPTAFWRPSRRWRRCGPEPSRCQRRRGIYLCG